MNAQPARDRGRRRAAVDFLEGRHDLGFGKSRLLTVRSPWAKFARDLTVSTYDDFRPQVKIQPSLPCR
jgi:hypothetical protein